MDPMLPNPPLKLKEYSLREKLLAELEHLDLTVSGHLLSLYNTSSKETVLAKELSRFNGRIVRLAGWLVTAKQTRTVNNELMKFITLEDTTALFEVVLFPRVYQHFGRLLYDRGPYIVKGRVEKKGHYISVTALSISRIEGQSKTY